MLTTKITGRFVIAFDGTRHRLLSDGEVVFKGNSIIFVGRNFAGHVTPS